jgi:hypothetical protein
MFCSKCGKELPDDSQFCAKCGHAVTPPTSNVPAPTQRSRPAHPIVWVLVAIFLGLAILWAWFPKDTSTNGSASRVPAISQRVQLPHTDIITDTAITVRANAYVYYRFLVPPGATNISVDGHFTATGGMGNDVEVLILSEDSFVNFQNRHSARTYYYSGKVTQSSINAVLPRGGNYYLIFNNNFSLLTPKAVQANATLHYTN